MLACDVTTNPSSASASRTRTSASCRARRRSAAMAGLEKADQTLESQPIALGAEAGHQPHGGVREHRAAPFRLPREDVREMHLHERHAHRERSEEHTSELQSRLHLVCRLLLEKKKRTHTRTLGLH